MKKRCMHVTAIQTRPLRPPKDDLLEVVRTSITALHEKDIVAVSSKVVAIWQGRCVEVPQDEQKAKALKETLVIEESEYYLPKDERFQYSRMWTVYEGVLGGSVGIDESNGDGYFILLPRNIRKTAEDIRTYLREYYGVTEVGVVIVDSKSEPMRNGVIGVSLAHAGFQGLKDYRGTKDIFGRELQFERLHSADCIASTATFMMGEGDECTPLVLFKDVQGVTFGDSENKDPMLDPNVHMKDDLFAQFLSTHPWKKGGRNKV